MIRPTKAIIRSCRWGYIDRPGRDATPARVRVWICEFPYQTIRRDGPDPDCEGCRRALGTADRRTA